MLIIIRRNTATFPVNATTTDHNVLLRASYMLTERSRYRFIVYVLSRSGLSMSL